MKAIAYAAWLAAGLCSACRSAGGGDGAAPCLLGACLRSWVLGASAALCFAVNAATGLWAREIELSEDRRDWRSHGAREIELS